MKQSYDNCHSYDSDAGIKDYLQTMLDQGHTIEYIASQTGEDETTIRYWIEKFKLKFRDRRRRNNDSR